MKRILLITILTLCVAISASAEGGIYNGMQGTLITIRGHAPYTFQPADNSYWPRFGVQIGVGYAQKFFTYEGVIEYMQTNVQPVQNQPEYVNSLQASARIGGMLPIQLGNTFMLIPNVKGQLGGAFYLGSGYSTRFQASVIGGLDLGVKLGKSTLTIGYVYEYRWYVYTSSTMGLGMMGGQLSMTF